MSDEYRDVYTDGSIGTTPGVSPAAPTPAPSAPTPTGTAPNGAAPTGTAPTGTASGYGTYYYAGTHTEPVYSEAAYRAPETPKKKKKVTFERVMAVVGCLLLAALLVGGGVFAVKSIIENTHISVSWNNNGKTGSIGGNSNTDNKTETPATEATQAAQISEVIENRTDLNTTTELLQASHNSDTAKVNGLLDVSDVAEAVMPAVVQVTNYYSYTTTGYIDFFYGSGNTTQTGEASGSGIIVAQNNNELLIVTNYHVIEDNEELSVQFIDGTTAEAYVKGTSSGKDLAVIAVNTTGLTDDTMNSIAIATVGDSNSLRVGEPAIAIGNALGYGQSVTTGVISALNRELTYEGITGTFIQTDAAINPGNSGGALLNSYGEVIGINSSKIGGSSVEGMGYAIPISDAIPIIEQLMNATPRAFLGIGGSTITEEMIEKYSIPTESGVCVVSVQSNSAASRAGIQQSDIITAINGQSIGTIDELVDTIASYSAGDRITITFLRQKRSGTFSTYEVEVELGTTYEVK